MLLIVFNGYFWPLRQKIHDLSNKNAGFSYFCLHIFQKNATFTACFGGDGKWYQINDRFCESSFFCTQ